MKYYICWSADSSYENDNNIEEHTEIELVKFRISQLSKQFNGNIHITVITIRHLKGEV